MNGFWREATALPLLVALATSPAGGQPKVLDGGHPVTWEGWSFSWKVLPQQGVVLTRVTFQGRSVLKYAGIAEVFVPYHPGTPRLQDQRIHPFGESLILLEPGVDCLPGGDCRAFAANGKPVKTKAAVMLHEEAASPVYMGHAGKAKAKTLVLWSAYALGDYTYIVQWRFREDGCLMPQVGMTGRLAYFGGDKSNSSPVAADRHALAHVHNFFFCLDFDVDGAQNTVEEFNYAVLDRETGKSEGFWTPLEKEGGRDLKPDAFRSWRVVNPASKNGLGRPRSYELIPSGTGIYRGRTSEKFAQADLWVTRYKPEEVPGTTFLADALPGYVNGENIRGEDVVLWYMLSVHHQPKAEDWPAMPSQWCGFAIAPRDFLDGSPLKPTK